MPCNLIQLWNSYYRGGLFLFRIFRLTSLNLQNAALKCSEGCGAQQPNSPIQSQSVLARRLACSREAFHFCLLCQGLTIPCFNAVLGWGLQHRVRSPLVLMLKICRGDAAFTWLVLWLGSKQITYFGTSWVTVPFLYTSICFLKLCTL